MSESGRESAPRSARDRLQSSQRSSLSSSAVRSVRLAQTLSDAAGSGSGSAAADGTSARSGTELWPGQAAEEAAREAARAEGAPPPGGYRPSAYQDQYLAGAAIEPFVFPLPGSGAGADAGPGGGTSAGKGSRSARARRGSSGSSGDVDDVVADRRTIDLGAGAEGSMTIDLTVDDPDRRVVNLGVAAEGTSAIDLTADDPDRRVVNLGVAAEGIAACDLTAVGLAGGTADGGSAAGAGTTAGPLFSRPGHQVVAGSIFAAPDQHAATGSLFAGSPTSGGGTILLPAGSPTAVEQTPAADHDGVDDRSDTALTEGKALRSRRGRTVALVGGLLAIVAAGVGGTFAWSALGGGGPQPETALPSTTVAFVKVDLDPSAGQKVDAVRFLRAFPQARDQVSEKSDLRELAFTALQDEGQLAGIDYRSDVAPWLGRRIALGIVPGASAQDVPVVVLALAVEDAGAARTHLPKVATALGGTCQLAEDFAVCTRGKDGSALDAVLTATARGSLADAATFRQDMGDLGEDGIVAGWVDSAKTAGLVGSLPLLGGAGPGDPASTGSDPDAGALPDADPTGPGLTGAVLGGLTHATGVLPAVGGGSTGTPFADAGRTAIALRFDGPHLELAGHTNGAKASFVGTEHVTGVTSLPWDSLAAVSIANGGAQLRAAWPEIDRAIGAGSTPAQGQAAPTQGTGVPVQGGGVPAQGKGALARGEGLVAAAEDLLGISLPEDLYAALGSQLTLVFGGVEERNGHLKAALVGNGDQVVLGTLATSGQAFGGEKLTLLPSPGRSILATSDEYGQEIVTGSGLGGMPGFQDAVQDVEDARAVVYVDIAGLVSEFKDEMDPKDVADLADLSALGVTVSGEGTSADFRVRLTTK